jgi:hypothetical protein
MNRLLCGAVVVALLVALGTGAMAAETVRAIDWAQQAVRAPGVTLVPAGEGGQAGLKVTNTGPGSVAVVLLQLDAPGLSQPVYALSGRLRSEGVTKPAYLEMWTYYPDGGRYFSRTQAARGPMGRLQGTSGWRFFAVPFFAKQTSAPPRKLVLSLVLPGPGTVELGPVALRQFAPGEDPLTEPGQWFSGRTGGLIGGLLGALLGTLGAAVGVLSSSGKRRELTLGLMLAGIVVGLALLAAGVAAVLARQPYSVYYPLLLAGGLTAVLCAAMRPNVARRYAELELRRMSAQDTA